MIELLREAARLERFFGAHDWRACFIGGIANLRWGEPRLTVDADATVFTGFGDEPAFITALLHEYQARVADAHAFALQNRVVLVKTKSGIPLDISLGGLPFESEMIGRASSGDFGEGVSLRTVGAEDLIVLKAFANRAQDWIDISGVVARQGAALDWGAILERLSPLVALKEEPEIMVQLDRIRRERSVPHTG